MSRATSTNSVSTIVKAVKATTSPKALSLVVKAAIHRRDTLLGKEVEELTLRFDRIVDAKSRARVSALCTSIAKLDVQKDIALLCKTAIARRAVANAAKA